MAQPDAAELNASRLEGLRRQAPVRVPAANPPDAAEQWYASQLVGLVGELWEAVEQVVLRDLRQLAETDPTGRFGRQDADEPPDYLAELKRRFSQIHGAWQVGRAVAGVIDRTNEGNERAVGRQLTSLGLMPSRRPDLSEAVKSATADNTRLIKNIPDEMAERIAGKVRAGWDAGKRHETLAKELEAEFGIASRRARLIARDQVNKINGSFTRARHLAAGITHFRWQSGRDNRVRPAHLALNGRVFSWDEPPDEGFPGQPIQCRCTAAPVVSDAETSRSQSPPMMRSPVAGSAPEPVRIAAQVGPDVAGRPASLSKPPAEAVPITTSPVAISRMGHVPADSSHVQRGMASLDLVHPALLEAVKEAGGEICFVQHYIGEHPIVREKYPTLLATRAYGMAFADEMLAVVTAWPRNDNLSALHEFAHLLQYAQWHLYATQEFSKLAAEHVDYIQQRWSGFERFAETPLEVFAEGFARFHLEREELATNAPKLYTFFKRLPYRVIKPR